MQASEEAALTDCACNRAAQLGAKKHYAQFEAWLWAARSPEVPATAAASPHAESAALAVVPVLPSRPAESAQAALRSKLVEAGLGSAVAAKACDDLALHASR